MIPGTLICQVPRVLLSPTDRSVDAGRVGLRGHISGWHLPNSTPGDRPRKGTVWVERGPSWDTADGNGISAVGLSWPPTASPGPYPTDHFPTQGCSPSSGLSSQAIGHWGCDSLVPSSPQPQAFGIPQAPQTGGPGVTPLLAQVWVRAAPLPGSYLSPWLLYK